MVVKMEFMLLQKCCYMVTVVCLTDQRCQLSGNVPETNNCYFMQMVRQCG